jgi:hypothetical protein
MATYYAITHKTTGKPLVSSVHLPIYWLKKVADGVAKNFKHHIVVPVDSDQLECVLYGEVVKKDTQKQIEYCRYVCTAYWRVEFDWVVDGRRDEDRPIMKKLLVMALLKKFPGIEFKTITEVLKQKSHAGIHRMLKTAKSWISHNDEQMMKYYEPVKHLLT